MKKSVILLMSMAAVLGIAASSFATALNNQGTIPVTVNVEPAVNVTVGSTALTLDLVKPMGLDEASVSRASYSSQGCDITLESNSEHGIRLDFYEDVSSQIAAVTGWDKIWYGSNNDNNWVYAPGITVTSADGRVSHVGGYELQNMLNPDLTSFHPVDGKGLAMSYNLPYIGAAPFHAQVYYNGLWRNDNLNSATSNWSSIKEGKYTGNIYLLVSAL